MRIGSPASLFTWKEGFWFPFEGNCMNGWSMRDDRIGLETCSRFGAMPYGSATTRPVGLWSNVLHSFAVPQFLQVRFEVVLRCHSGCHVVDRAAIGNDRMYGRKYRSLQSRPTSMLLQRQA